MFGDDISDRELKQRWRLYWIHTIFEFSNLKLQRMAWIEGEKAEWPNAESLASSYEAYISAYFDDLALDDAYEKSIKWGNVSQSEADHGRKFHQLIVFYDEPSDNPEDILNDVEWMEVVEAAKEFWSFLKTNVTEQREVDLIRKLETSFF